MSLAFWVCGIVTAVSAAVSLGYSIAGLVAAAGTDHTASMSALARSAALGVVALAALFTGSMPFLTAIAAAMVLVQAADAVVGTLIRDRFKTLGLKRPGFRSESQQGESEHAQEVQSRAA